MKNIAIIPARSGSKGLPNKNILPLNGKPLIGYTIEAALQSGCFHTVMVSTDSEEYAAVAKSYGAEVPFLRSEKTSTDQAGSWDVVKEVLEKYGIMGEYFDSVALLQPTSPFRKGQDIQNAYGVFERKNASSVISVCETDHPAQWCFTLDAENSMADFAKSPYKDKRRQELPKTYRENGAIYIVKTQDFIRGQDVYENCFAYKMNKGASLDIDDANDFKIAEVLIKED